MAKPGTLFAIIGGRIRDTSCPGILLTWLHRFPEPIQSSVHESRLKLPQRRRINETYQKPLEECLPWSCLSSTLPFHSPCSFFPAPVPQTRPLAPMLIIFEFALALAPHPPGSSPAAIAILPASRTVRRFLLFENYLCTLQVGCYSRNLVTFVGLKNTVSG
jgi:hypothetical protein